MRGASHARMQGRAVGVVQNLMSRSHGGDAGGSSSSSYDASGSHKLSEGQSICADAIEAHGRRKLCSKGSFAITKEITSTLAGKKAFRRLCMCCWKLASTSLIAESASIYN